MRELTLTVFQSILTVDDRKEELQTKFRDRLSLNMFHVRPGYGSSNVGNNAKVAFDNWEILADILEFPVDLVLDLKTLLDALSCGLPIDPVQFKSLTESWLDRFHASDFKWNWLSPTVHMLMVHGAEIICNTPVACGLLSEEGAEHNNKMIRSYRAHHARQTSVEANLEDVFKRALYFTDPLVQGHFSRPPVQRSSTLPPRVQELLVKPEAPMSLNNVAVEE